MLGARGLRPHYNSLKVLFFNIEGMALEPSVFNYFNLFILQH